MMRQRLAGTWPKTYHPSRFARRETPPAARPLLPWEDVMRLWGVSRAILQPLIRRGRSCLAGLGLAVALVHAPGGPAVAQLPEEAPVSAAAGAMLARRNNDTGPQPPPGPGEVRPLSDSERQAFGCLWGTGAGVLATVTGGPTETILIIAGGALVPTNPIVLWMALSGTVLAAMCASSALAAPGVVRLWNYYYLGMRPATREPERP